jgi:hypothetical protein
MDVFISNPSTENDSPAGFIPEWAGRSILFRLPTELRLEVYKHYVREDQGYFYDADAGKLRLAGNQPVDLSLYVLGYLLHSAVYKVHV